MFTLRIEVAPIDIHLHAPGEPTTNAFGLIQKQLSQLKDIIMASRDEIVQKLDAVNAQQQKTLGEIQGLQTKVNELNSTIEELKAVIAAGGDIPQEVSDAVDRVAAKAQEVDDAIPDVPATPPTA